MRWTFFSWKIRSVGSIMESVRRICLPTSEIATQSSNTVTSRESRPPATPLPSAIRRSCSFMRSSWLGVYSSEAVMLVWLVLTRSTEWPSSSKTRKKRARKPVSLHMCTDSTEMSATCWRALTAFTCGCTPAVMLRCRMPEVPAMSVRAEAPAVTPGAPTSSSFMSSATNCTARAMSYFSATSIALGLKGAGSAVEHSWRASSK
mmetsp:Transcript_2883/g.10118  ORF Transcript_2883/g.10118 Transcript_2883/m.10118 type:complete len:204 (-) Transcript_2883:467-1078(-)